MFVENVRIAMKSIRTNLLRTILTVMIIAFGIMALVGILTAIDSIKYALTESFSLMGANTFTIESRSMRVQIGNESYRRKNHEFISHKQAQEFKDMYELPAKVSVWTRASGSAVVKYKSYKSNPNTSVLGVDEDYIFTAGYEMEKGRNLTTSEISSNANTVLIGADLAREAFEKNQNPLNRFITVGNGRYRNYTPGGSGELRIPRGNDPLYQCQTVLFQTAYALLHQCDAQPGTNAGCVRFGSRRSFPSRKKTGCQGRNRF